MTWLRGVTGLNLGLLLLSQVAAVQADQGPESHEGFWYVQTSVYTTHFGDDGDHDNHQHLVGLERDEKSGLIYGGTTFRNSFRQQSAYAYIGKRFDAPNLPLYLKLTGGLLYGYRGEYRDNIPLNQLGIAPAIIPSIGAYYGRVGAELVLLGNMAAMVNLGLRF